MKRLLYVLMLCMISFSAMAFEAPKLIGRVNDYANILTTKEISNINAKLEKLEKKYKDGPEMAILLISKLPSDAPGIEEYTNDVARSWGVGKKGLNNGIVMVLAINTPVS